MAYLNVFQKNQFFLFISISTIIATCMQFKIFCNVSMHGSIEHVVYQARMKHFKLSERSCSLSFCQYSGAVLGH